MKYRLLLYKLKLQHQCQAKQQMRNALFGEGKLAMT
jgi:hypothetical protein